MRISLRAIVACALMTYSLSASAASTTINRRDAFLTIWQSIQRPAEQVRSHPFSDVAPGDPGQREIDFAEVRGMIDAVNGKFWPNEPLTYDDALVWLFRTRSREPLRPENQMPKIGPPPLPTLEEAQELAKYYKLPAYEPSATLSQEQLVELMRSVDTALANEVHEASLYSEKFHGKGTAFGESFDMHALTAAHRSYPHNTLVRVTNIENGKNVVVRINDRGPFVAGRDIDLSLASFTTIADRAKGKIDVRFERLGDSGMVNLCHENRLSRRIDRTVILTPGISPVIAFGQSVTLTSESFFVVRSVIYPSGDREEVQEWVSPGETYSFAPETLGKYVLRLATKTGKTRIFEVEVRECR